MPSKPISDYALIGNCRSAALVARDGSIDWWCAQRFDSPAVFARLLDDRAGYFEMAPIAAFEATRRYLEESMVLETTMTTATGTVVLTDALALGPHETGHEIGFASPAVVMRRARCVAGYVEMRIEVAPRPEFGLVTPIVEPHDGGVALCGGPDTFVLSLAKRPFEVSRGLVRSQTRLSANQTWCIALERVSSSAVKPNAWSQRRIAERIEQTLRGWRSWSAMHQSYRGEYRDLVLHSGRVLQALTYQPTGAIVAAPTTSLPESPGGTLNWDYRYSWVRDAALTMNALWTAACPDEAERYFRWLAFTAGGDVRGNDLQVVFGVGGEHDLTEHEIPYVRGWRDSGPVRVGNAAWRQRQIDVYGEVVGAAYRFRDQIATFDGATRTFVVDAVERAADLWRETGHGLWESRDEPQHFTYSKLMCWQALEAGIALAGELGSRERVIAWARCRDEIDAAIRTLGWNESKRAYVQTFGSDRLDASALFMVICGFLRKDDPRARSTVDAIARELAGDRLVRRYAGDGDGNTDAGFVLCSFWLAHAQAVLGDVDEARATFDATMAHANDVSLLAEQIDVNSGELLGNFPLAISHVGLINAAAAIDAASLTRMANVKS